MDEYDVALIMLGLVVGLVHRWRAVHAVVTGRTSPGTARYRYRITGIRKDDPDRQRQVAYDPSRRYTMCEIDAKNALSNMRTGEYVGWRVWEDLRIERRVVDTGWEEVE